MYDISSMELDQTQNNINNSLVECDIKIIGDKQTTCEVVQLLSYIRNVLKNKQQKDIIVKVGHTAAAEFFGFSVNGQEIKDYIAKDILNIN